MSSLPTFLVLNKDLMIAGIIKGYAPAKEFAASLGDAEVKYNDFMKRANDEAAISKDYAKRFALAKEFESRAAYAQSEARLKKLIAEPGIPATVRDDSYFELALNQILQKKFADAKATLAKFATLQNKGDSYERSRLLIGDIYLQTGNIQGALEEYKSFKAKYPNSVYVRNIDMMIPQLERQLGGPRKQ